MTRDSTSFFFGMAEIAERGKLAAGSWFTIVVGVDGNAYRSSHTHTPAETFASDDFLSLYSFGDDLSGQCGHGPEHRNEYTFPTRIESLVGKNIAQVRTSE